MDRDDPRRVEPEPEPRPYRGARITDEAAELRELKKKGKAAGGLSLGLKGVMSLIALWRGSHWMLSDQEALIWATDINEMMSEVLPKEYLEAYYAITEKYSSVVGTALTTTAIVGKRLRIDSELKSTEAARPQAPSGKSAGADQGWAGGFAGPGPAGAGADNGRGAAVDGGGYSW